MRILIVEDDARTAEAVADLLRLQRHVVDVTTDGQDAFNHARLAAYDLMLIDIMLPGIDGLTLCRKLRASGDQAMILIITARDAIEDKVATLDAGADDYIVKPFNHQELSARVRAVARRSREAKPTLMQWGELVMDPGSARVFYRASYIPLTRTEYAILETLMRNSEQIFTRTLLQDKVTSFDSEGSIGSIKTHITNLRRKLRDAGCKDPIETVYGSGYRLADVR